MSDFITVDKQSSVHSGGSSHGNQNESVVPGSIAGNHERAPYIRLHVPVSEERLARVTQGAHDIFQVECPYGFFPASASEDQLHLYKELLDEPERVVQPMDLNLENQKSVVEPATAPEGNVGGFGGLFDELDPVVQNMDLNLGSQNLVEHGNQMELDTISDAQFEELFNIFVNSNHDENPSDAVSSDRMQHGHSSEENLSSPEDAGKQPDVASPPSKQQVIGDGDQNIVVDSINKEASFIKANPNTSYPSVNENGISVPTSINKVAAKDATHKDAASKVTAGKASVDKCTPAEGTSGKCASGNEAACKATAGGDAVNDELSDAENENYEDQDIEVEDAAIEAIVAEAVGGEADAEGQQKSKNHEFIAPIEHILDPLAYGMATDTLFASAEEAFEWQQYTFKTPPPDHTVPTSMEAKKSAVIALSNAMKATAHAQDNPGVVARWKASMDEKRIEFGAWYILTLLIERSLKGPLVQSLENAKADRKGIPQMNFMDRFERVRDALYRRKTICKRVTDFTWISGFVDNPEREEKRSAANQSLNKKKGDYVQVGKQVLQATRANEDGDAQENEIMTPVMTPSQGHVNSNADKALLTPVSNPPSVQGSRSQPRARANRQKGAGGDESPLAGRKPKATRKNVPATTTATPTAPATPSKVNQAQRTNYLPNANVGPRRQSSLNDAAQQQSPQTQNRVLGSNIFLPQAIKNQLGAESYSSQFNGFVQEQPMQQNFGMKGVAFGQQPNRPVPQMMLQGQNMVNPAFGSQFDPSFLAQMQHENYNMAGASGLQQNQSVVQPMSQDYEMVDGTYAQPNPALHTQAMLENCHVASPFSYPQSSAPLHTQMMPQGYNMHGMVTFPQPSASVPQNIQGQGQLSQAQMMQGYLMHNQNRLMAGQVPFQQLRQSPQQMSQNSAMAGQISRPYFDQGAQLNYRMVPIGLIGHQRGLSQFASNSAMSQGTPVTPNNGARRKRSPEDTGEDVIPTPVSKKVHRSA